MLGTRACLVATVTLSLLLHACASDRATESSESEGDELSDFPNELRSAVYELPELDEATVRHAGFSFRVKLDPFLRTPRLAFRLPEAMGPEDVLAQIVAPHLGKEIAFAPKGGDAVRQVFGMTYRGAPVEGAWAHGYHDKKGRLVFVLSVPPLDSAPVAFEDGTKPSGLALAGGVFTELSRTPSDDGARVTFPARAALPERAETTLVATKSATAQVEKVQLPQGTFPDEIRITSKGEIWFSQPFDNIVTRYTVDTKSWLHVPVGPEPDGLWVDRHDNVWFGEYTGTALGFVSAGKNEYTHYVVPANLQPKSPAIPFEDAAGLIWVADHEANRIYRFDATKRAFIDALPVPTAGAWPVDLKQTTKDANLVYVAEAFAHRLGVIAKDKSAFTEITLSISGEPAFMAIVGSTVWATEWSQPGFVKYDLTTKALTEFTFSDGTDGKLGPIAALPTGEIALGGLTNGRVYLFKPSTRALVYVDGIGALKDGMTSRARNETWVTESGTTVDRISWRKPTDPEQ